MNKLTIKDLPVNEELDRRAMAAVRGGTAIPYAGFDISKLVTSFMPQQFVGQTQTVLTENGSNIAFADGLIARANVAPKQDARNIANINFGSAGDLA